MKTLPTFKEQFDKLTRAYIEDRVNPDDTCACFIGNLLNGNHLWANGRLLNINYGENKVQPTLCSDLFEMKNCLIDECGSLYTPLDIIKMEKCFLDVIMSDHMSLGIYSEDTLFLAFEKTLELLKQIHISKGENIEEQFEFKKRELVAV